METVVVFDSVLHCSIIECEIYNLFFEYNNEKYFVHQINAKLNWLDNQIHWLNFEYDNKLFVLSANDKKNYIPDSIILQAIEFLSDENNYTTCTSNNCCYYNNS